MKKKQRLYRTLFFSVVILYFIYKLIFGLLIKEPDTQIVEFGELSTEKEYECLIVRNERIVKSPSEGIIKYYVEEGEKVEKNYKVSEIYTSDVSDEDREQLKKLNSRIEDIQSSKGDLFKIDVDRLNIEINNIVDELRSARIQDDFTKLSDLKIKLESKIDKKRRVSGDKSFSGANLDRLKGEKNKLETRIKNSILQINSPESGIISYYIDGYEEILTPQNLANIKYEFIKGIESNSDKLRYDKVIFNQSIFKITDNTAWYIVIITDFDDANSFEIGKKVSVDILESRITGKITDKIQDDTKSFIIVRTNQYVSGFNNIRKANFKVIREHREGLKIHRDSVVERDGEMGVFLLSVNRKAIFRPIKVLGYDDDYVIVEINYFEVKEGDSSKRVRTVKLYDEVLRYGKKYKEGDIVY
ncbi:MAG: hypothetical protein MJA82_14155 [Clostridia bacterium]|nr:hypothetical protein [Clostridia bacterium]